MEPLSGAIVAPGGGPLVLGPGKAVSIMSGRVVLARMGIGGPLDRKVLASASTRLDYRRPTITHTYDFETHESNTTVDVDPIITYLPKTIVVLGVRHYRIWVEESEWVKQNWSDQAGRDELEAEVLLRLIDADGRDVQACREQ
jgi:hypothetical protein